MRCSKIFRIKEVLKLSPCDLIKVTRFRVMILTLKFGESVQQITMSETLQIVEGFKR